MTEKATITIKYGPTDQDAIDFAHSYGLFIAGEGILSGIRDLNAALRILNAFEAISVEETVVREGGREEKIRRLVEGGAELVLESRDAPVLRRVIRTLLVDNPRKERPLSAIQAVRICGIVGIELESDD